MNSEIHISLDSLTNPNLQIQTDVSATKKQLN